jgi:MoaA/NifB/PqqE/SkfB family radical SAM enzyme
METHFNLEEYLSNGVEKVVKGIFKASFSNPKASLFMMKYIKNSKLAREKRRAAEEQGEHIPPFLIASITNKCNLHCKGCYARANHSCTDHCSQDGMDGLLTGEQWGSIFDQAKDMGIEFILLAGGEPFVRIDVLQQAAKQDHLLFPIFTNGTMIDEQYIELLSQNRNLMPVISIEGNQQTTDARRGEGIYQKLVDTMTQLKQRGIIFGASVTVTKENVLEVMSDVFINQLGLSGVKAIIYVEYVPVDKDSMELAPDDQTREMMMTRLNKLRFNISDMLFIAFPGDEKTSGGCLAAGRGFFHINARGGAEPCPFSPYSDTNVIDTSLREALHSPLFCKLHHDGNLTKEHIGGCVLFEQQQLVESMVQG